MKLTVLGSGTGWPRLERKAPSYLLQIEDENLLFDIGPGSIYQLLKTGLTLSDIDFILISHFHPDHVTDLISFLFATRYSLGYKRSKPFQLFASEAFSPFYEALRQAFGHSIEPPNGLMSMHLLPLSHPSALLFPPFELRATPVLHKPESLAYRIDFQNKSLVYSGDTDFCSNLIDLAYKADLLILECSSTEDKKLEGHLTPSLAGRIAAEAQVSLLLLSHFYPPCDEVDIISPCKKYFKGEVIIAYDLLSLAL